jgi:glycosyltransferase involved in cell wall biosynthesis
MGLKNVIMVPQKPRSDMPVIWAATDVSLVMLKNSPVFRTVIPSKIFEAMAMARPVVLAVEGTAQRIVEAGRCGIAVRPENAFDLANAIRSLAADPALRETLGSSGREYVRARYTRPVLADRYIQILRSTSQTAASPMSLDV